MEGKILTWNDFRDVCKEDAYNWKHAGWTAKELSEQDILNEYPEDYFENDTSEECDDLSRCFTQKEFAQKTLEYLEEIENDE